MPFGTKNTSFYPSIFMKFFVLWCYYRVLKYSTWVVSEKILGRPDTPNPHILVPEGWPPPKFLKIFEVDIFFKEGESKKNFLRKDAYWVTWPHMKRLGHIPCTTWATAAEKAKKAGFGNFWPNPQIGFSAILGRGCVGAGWQHMEKNLWT